MFPESPELRAEVLRFLELHAYEINNLDSWRKAERCALNLDSRRPGA